MLSLENLRPFGYRVLVELLDTLEEETMAVGSAVVRTARNPGGNLWVAATADKRQLAPRLARVLKLPSGKGFACHCKSCTAVRETMHDLTQAPPDVDLRRADLGSLAEGDIVLLQTHGGTAVDLRGAGIDLSRHGLAESPVKGLLVLAHQILALVSSPPVQPAMLDDAAFGGIHDLQEIPEESA